MLSEFGVTDEMVCSVLQRSVGKGVSGAAPSQGLTPRAKSVVELAVSEASRMGSSAIGTAHLLMGLLREGGNMGLRILRTVGVDPNKMYSAVLKKLNDMPRAAAGGASAPNREADKKNKTLAEYTRDLTEAARSGKLDPVIGRDTEIQRVIQILSRRSKNNPVLIGEPGVGKPAIAAGLAERIAAGDVPEELLDKRILSLDLSGMVAGTKYRGEFEERIKNTLNEVKKDGNVILFIGRILREKNLTFQPLVDIRPRVFLRKGHPLSGERAVRLEQLYAYPYAVFTQSDSTSHFAEEAGVGTGAEFDRVVSVSDRATAYTVMAHTDCVSTGSGVLPDGYGDDRLMTLPLIGDVPDMRLGVIRPRDVPLTDYGEKFIAILKDIVSELNQEA